MRPACAFTMAAKVDNAAATFIAVMLLRFQIAGRCKRETKSKRLEVIRVRMCVQIGRERGEEIEIDSERVETRGRLRLRSERINVASAVLVARLGSS